MDLDLDDQPSAAAAKAGARFKPKGRPQPKKKQVVSLPNSQATLSSSTDVSKETLSTQTVSTSETILPDSGTVNHCNTRTLTKENVGEVNCFTRPSILRACTKVGLEKERCDDGIEKASTIHDDPRTQDSTECGDFVTPETDEVIHAQRNQTEEEECHLDMETLDIVQEECITSAYEQHTGKFQPKPRLLDTVFEERKSHDTGANEPELMVDVEARNDFTTSSTFTELQEETLHSPQVPEETAPEMEHEKQTNNTVTGEERSGRKGKRGKSKGSSTRKRKTTSEDDPSKSSENLEKKKFKHSTRRQRKRTLEKELLETPDEEIRYLPIRDMLRLVEHKEWLEKKERKGEVPVVPPVQESNQYHSQDFGFGEEDEFGLEEGENQEARVVKPDSPVNYQTYMKKTSRARWSKQDTELFYEGIQEFGSNLSMVQQLFPDRTRQQIKLKFKSEERRYLLKLNDALASRSKELTHFQNVIKKLQQEAAAAREGEGEEDEEEGEEDGAVEAETETTTTDVPENEEEEEEQATKCEAGDEVGGGKESDGGDECCDDDDDDDFWNSYKSEM